jgi:general secretion pathway protein G
MVVSTVIGLMVWTLHRDASAAKIRQTQTDLNMIDGSLRLFRMSSGVYPTNEQGIKALVESPSRPPIPRRWVQTMHQLPSDAWGNSFIYQLSENSEPRVICRGPDGLEGTKDDIIRRVENF